MKKLTTALACLLCSTGLYAQKCLDINILSQMGRLEAPGGAASCFGACSTKTGEHGEKIIVDYGVSDNQIDALVKQTIRDFDNAAMMNSNSGGQTPSQRQMTDAKALAEKMQSMTDEQRKAYVTQMVQQMQNGNAHPANAENAQAANLVMRSRNIVTTQLKPLDDEFAAKFRAIRDGEKKERDAVEPPHDNKCPVVDKVALPSCSCVNGLAMAYWKQIVTIEDNYNKQKAALLQSYLPRIKYLVGQVEDIISQLKYGDAVKTAEFKKMLLSSQSGAFGMAFDISGAVIHDIRTTGADAYLHEYNSINLKEDLACSTGYKL